MRKYLYAYKSLNSKSQHRLLGRGQVRVSMRTNLERIELYDIMQSK